LTGLGNFAMTEGQLGGEFYTPTSIVKLIVEIIEPYHGRIYDPACGSGGMFVQSQKFVQEHQGRKDDIHIFGQEYTAVTWRLCKITRSAINCSISAEFRISKSYSSDC